MAAHDHSERIRKWLQGLADCTAAGSEPVTVARIATMAEMLAMDFPPAAFTSAALHHCTQGQRFFPALDDLRRALHAWWDPRRPAAGLAIAGPALPNLDPMDRSWLTFWHRRQAEIGADSVSREAADAALALVADLVRSKSPRAWEAVSGFADAEPAAPTEAAIVAVARLLRPDPEAGSRRFEVVEPPPPFRDVTAKGEDLVRIRASGRRVAG